MSYTVNKTNGAILATVADGTIDSGTSDITLIGKNYAGYGELQNENFVKMLENFANTSAPSTPLAGQLYWDTASNVLQVYTGTAWKTLAASVAAAAAPSGSVTGDMWWDTVNSQLFVYNGTSFSLVGPAFTTATGVTGPVIATITDTLATDHVVVQMFVNDTIVAMISKDAEFTPQSAIAGFATIRPGYNLSTTVTGAAYVGTATNAELLDNLDSTSFLRSDEADTTSFSLGIQNDAGLTVGSDDDALIDVSGADVRISNVTDSGDIVLRTTNGVVQVTATLDAATNRIELAGAPLAANHAANRDYVDGLISTTGNLLYRDGSNTVTGDILPDADAARDLGSALARYQDIYAVNLNGNLAGTAATATVSTNATITDNTTENATLYPVFVDATTGNRPLEVDSSSLTYNPNTDTLTAGVFSGTATQAQYADVAEKFSPDAAYAPGTVVALGGPEEITAAVEADENVFGVVSTNPAHTMNYGLEGGLPVALTGRVPVRVVGEVFKGDRLVSAGNGNARAAKPGEATAFNVIGRALEDGADDMIEAFVTVN